MASAVDVLSINCGNHHSYVLSISYRCIEKIKDNRVEVVMIEPIWQKLCVVSKATGDLDESTCPSPCG